MNLRTVMDYADIIRSAEHGWEVARLIDETIVVGVARSVGDARGSFAGSDAGVDTLYLRVTTLSGWEEFWPLKDLLTDYRAGTYSPRYNGG